MVTASAFDVPSPPMPVQSLYIFCFACDFFLCMWEAGIANNFFWFSSLKSILKFITRLSNKLLYKKPSNNMNQHSFAYNSSISVEPGPKHLYSSTLQYVFQTMYLQFYIMKKVSIPPAIPYTFHILRSQ